MSKLVSFDLNQSSTMSSLEIAELTGKKHTNVIRDIRTQIFVALYGFKDDSNLSHDGIQGLTVTLDNRGYWSEVFLDRYHTDILVSGYEVKYRAAIVKRWHELETKQSTQFQIPKTLSDALLLAGQLAAEKEAAIAKLEAERPKIAFAEAIRNLEGSCSMEEFGKSFGIGRNTLFKTLRERNVLQKNNLPYQRYLDSGYFVVVEQIPYTDSKGKTHPSFSTRVTGTGQVWLEKNLRSRKAALVN